jgi:quinol monooxygenase YgiN
MIRVVAHFKPKPGKLDEVRRLLLSVTDPTRREKGCEFYDLRENPGDPEDLTFIEEWETVEDLDAYGQSTHIREGQKRMPDLMDVVDVPGYRLLE